ncbi:MAG: AAA family ATPase [bacterium]|nr:AAA family ATPase [bacterium]
MIERQILSQLMQWKAKKNRKPLVLRGARQVGKTTLVAQFGKSFQQYIYLNLELPEDQQHFLQHTSLEAIIASVFYAKNKQLSKRKGTLLFIDEIQEVPAALGLLRYFYEHTPDLHVIAAGSLLETVFNKTIHYPVGRVEFLAVRPISFPEYLQAIGEHSSLEQLSQLPIAPFAHTKLLKLFQQYTLIGGMPEIVNHYAEHRDLVSLKPLYESLLLSYIDDVEKYAENTTHIQTLRLAIRTAFSEAGKRIRFHGFGSSNYGSREMGEALRALEKTLLIHLIYPTTGVKLPLLPDHKKAPRLQVLDTGMINYFAGLQGDILSSPNLDAIHEGLIIEHMVGQELLAAESSILETLNFWVREKKTSMAEVDFLYKYNGLLIPIEVKKGATGKLKSLHLYMELAPHDMAIRLHSGPFDISIIQTANEKTYHLLSLPYYLVSQLHLYLPWFEKQKRTPLKKKNAIK